VRFEVGRRGERVKGGGAFEERDEEGTEEGIGDVIHLRTFRKKWAFV
jgi:hypothetical protein